MHLFEVFERTFDQPKTELESSFNFLNRSLSGPEFCKSMIRVKPVHLVILILKRKLG